METPNLTHISSDDYLHVYEPAEDSFLLLNAIEKEQRFLSVLQPTVCLEVGSGSGVLITAFAMAFPNCVCMSTDLNPKACEVTLLTSKANCSTVETVNMDLAMSFRENLFDVVIFNPPYVITDSSEIAASDISRSWAGGIKGREVIDRFLPTLPSLLSVGGVCYMLLIKDNIPAEVIQYVESIGFRACCLIERKVYNERQAIFKFTKTGLIG